jgi:hypothetical protein
MAVEKTRSKREKRMPKRRDPVETALTSTIIYPSSLFSLQKDEVYPYERFAYNILHVGVEALSKKNLPERFVIDFTRLPAASSPWTLNASVACEMDSGHKPLAFRFGTPELVPALMYLFIAAVAHQFLDDEEFHSYRRDPGLLCARIQLFVDAASASVRGYRQSGFGSGVRGGYDHLGLTIEHLYSLADDYNLLAKLVANHEVGHAYVQQFTYASVLAEAERKAFEFLADMVGTAWFYNEMVANTPDTAEYRKFRSMNSYGETIYANCLATLRAQQILLVFMAIAGAQRTGGIVSLAGGSSHPGGLERYFLQYVQLYTLIESNFSSVLSGVQLKTLQEDWDLRMEILIHSRLIRSEDLHWFHDDSNCDALEKVADLIEKLKVGDLKKIGPTLRDFCRRFKEP